MHVKGHFHIQIYFMKRIVQAFVFNLQNNIYNIVLKNEERAYKLLIYCMCDTTRTAKAVGETSHWRPHHPTGQS